MGKSSKLEAVRKKVNLCCACHLWLERKNPVLGEGDLNADIILCGESAGEKEDQTGKPFCGKSGKLLTKILTDVELSRESVYICNIIKCHPPNNRDPEPREVEACLPYLRKQIEIISPKVIVLLGAVALKSLFNDPKASIGKSRGIWKEYEGIPVLPTYHPAFLLYNSSEENKKLMKSDLKLAIIKANEK